MNVRTENSVICYLNSVTSNFPVLSDCATAALKCFISINIFGSDCCSNNSIKNYQYLMDILELLHNNLSLLSQSDNDIWKNYRKQQNNIPDTHHQLPGLAKAIIKGGFFP